MGSIIKKVDKNGKTIFDINFIFRLNYKFLTITFRWGSAPRCSAGCWILDGVRAMLDFGCWMLDSGFWMFDFG